MRRKIFISFFIFVGSFCFLFTASPVQAHIGGGPPFVKVDGKYANTNQYYQGETTLNIPQDFPPDSYLVNKPIKIEIDVDQLTKQTTIPPQYARQLTFRWSVMDGDNFDHIFQKYKYGNSISYTFTKPKSYLLIVEAKAPFADNNYIIIDTVQLNVVPTLSYQLPKVAVFVGVKDQKTQNSVLLVSQTTFDPQNKSEKYIWDFNDGKLENGLSIDHTFDALSPYVTRFVYNRVIDGDGFISDIGFAGENFQGRLRFVPFGNMRTVPVTTGSYADAIKKANPVTQNMSGIFIAIGLVIVGFIFYKMFLEKIN